MKVIKLGVVLVALTIGSLAVPAVAQDDQAKTERRMNGMDADQNGAISLAEFTEFRRSWTSKRDDAEMQMQPDVVQRAFDRIDSNGDGSISFAELLADTRKSKSKR